MEAHAGELDALCGALRSKHDVLVARSALDAVELARCEPTVGVVLGDADVLAETRPIIPDARRVLLARGGADPDALMHAMNRCGAHHVARAPAGDGDAALLVAALVELSDAYLREREVHAKETFLTRSLDDQGKELLGATAEIERISRDLDVLSFRDSLTGLYNHRAFQERLREEMARARRYGKPLSLLYCDIDEFAKINTELGYQTGDAILRRLAEVLSTGDAAGRLRESDVAARFGGEELVILLPETSKEGASIKAERMRASVERASFPHDRTIRISIGIAGFPDDADSPDDLVRSAERALASAKAAGRNCVRVVVTDASVATSSGQRPQRPSDPVPATPGPERFTSYHVRLFDIVSSLRRDRSLCCLFVDLSQLRDVERELGLASHVELFARAGDFLDALRGDRLRRDDLICRTEDSDGYLCFLSSPRDASSPIDLESIGARVEATLDRELRSAMSTMTRELPRVVVGYSRVLDNPLVRPERLVVRLVTEARRSALLHRERATQRHKALLQEIILRNMLQAVYQPIVDLRSGSMFAFEALARGPRDSTLESPTALFTVADEVDLTFELDRACFRSALAGAVGIEPIHRLFVNLLPASFYDSSFIESEVSNLLEAAALTPANVVFEITEKLAIENFASFRQALGTYTRMGFGVAIDDVGTRHSNLETVMALRPHFVKLSDVLTRGVSSSTVKREMVRSLQRIAETIDAVVVAEGIETQDDLAVLAELGVRYGQGYFLARPGPPFPRLRSAVKRALAHVMRPREMPILVPSRTSSGIIDDDDGEERDPPPSAPQHTDDFSEPTRPRLKPMRPASSAPPPLRGGDEGVLSPLGDELGGLAGGGTPLIRSLRRTQGAGASDDFQEETTSGGGAGAN
ncbi:MAG TPA: EAL domain-containing protein [Kofleriaceae bacterium]|nr:EAL domain-containing protein [Kofleriaceae bacterium]